MIVQDRIIEATDIEEAPEGIVDKNNRENYINERYGSINRDRSRSREELLQGIMAITEIEAQATIDLDQGLELVQIGIG